MTSAYKMHTRDSIRRRLGTMDTQIDAIEAMANNMEDEFRSTHVVSAGSAFWVVRIDITVDTSMNTSVDTSVDTCSFLLLAAAEHDRSDRREHPTCKRALSPSYRRAGGPRTTQPGGRQWRA